MSFVCRLNLQTISRISFSVFLFIEFFDLDKDIKAIIVEILLRILLNYANGEFNLILVFREIYDQFVLLTFYFENLS